MPNLKEIEENQYKVDFEISKGYIDFFFRIVEIVTSCNGRLRSFGFDKNKRRKSRRYAGVFGASFDIYCFHDLIHAVRRYYSFPPLLRIRLSQLVYRMVESR